MEMKNYTGLATFASRYDAVKRFQLYCTQQLVRFVLHCYFAVVMNRRTRFARLIALQVGLCVLPASAQLELRESNNIREVRERAVVSLCGCL